MSQTQNVCQYAMRLTDLTDSSSTTTGALSVYGGLSIGKTLNAAGTVNLLSTTAIGSGVIPTSATGAALNVNGDIVMPGAKTFYFTQQAYAAPSKTNRSIGTKIVLYPTLSSTSTDYAIGINSAVMWFSLDATTSSYMWYGADTPVMTLTGTGAISVTGTGKIGSVHIGSTPYEQGSYVVWNRVVGSGTTEFINQYGQGNVGGFQWTNYSPTNVLLNTPMTLSNTGILNITTATDSTSPTTGALVISGGVGIGKTLFVMGRTAIIGSGSAGATSILDLSTYLSSANIPTHRIVTTDEGGYAGRFEIQVKPPGNDTNALVTRFGISSTGIVTLPTAADSSSTTTGALQVAGGVGIAKSLSVGSTTFLYGATGQNAIVRFFANGQTANYFEIGQESGYNFHVFNQAGNGVYLTNGGTAWAGFSDRRLKRDISAIPVTGCLDRISSLEPVTYRWNSDPKTEDATTKKKQGFIAQDVLEVLPEIVDEDSEWLGLTMTDLIPYMIAAFKELKQSQDEIRSRLNKIENNFCELCGSLSASILT